MFAITCNTMLRVCHAMHKAHFYGVILYNAAHPALHAEQLAVVQPGFAGELERWLPPLAAVAESSCAFAAAKQSSSDSST
jgi:hypothetical protein